MDKRFDRIVKAFADEAPLTLLGLLGIVPAGAQVEVTPLRPETAPAMVIPDYAATVAVDSGEPFTFHVEFQLEYRAGVPARMARYGVSLAWQHGRRTVSVLLLLRPEGVPAEIPEVGVYAIGETRGTHPYRVVRLWEIDVLPIIESRDPRLYPWGMLMRLSETQARQLAAALAKLGDEELLGRFLTLGSLRYDRKRLEEMLGGPEMGLVEAILQGSSLVREVVEKAAQESLEKGREEGEAKGREEGEAKGREEGEAKGRTQEAQRLLRSALRKSFPGLEQLPEIDEIAKIESLEDLLLNEVLPGRDREQVRIAIIRAAGTSASTSTC